MIQIKVNFQDESNYEQHNTFAFKSRVFHLNTVEKTTWNKKESHSNQKNPRIVAASFHPTMEGQTRSEKSLKVTPLNNFIHFGFLVSLG